jgi:hypothetical protein
MKIIRPIIVSFIILSISPNSTFSKCYEINLDTINISGLMTIDTTSKNRRKIENENDNCFMLKLYKPICIVSEIENKNDSIQIIQIMINENKIKNALKYLNMKVRLKGKLYRSLDNRNKSPILIELFKIVKLK